MHVTAQEVALAGVVVGGLGIVVPAAVRRGDRKHEVGVAVRQLIFPDRSQAYVAMLDIVNRMELFYARTFPVGGPTPPLPLPELPEEEALLAIDARVSTYGSERTYAALRQWDTARNDVLGRALVLRTAEEQGRVVTGAMEAYQASRERLTAAADRLEEQVRRDLGETPSQPRWVLRVAFRRPKTRA